MSPQDMTGRFADKVAIVTGSSANPSIGHSCALRLGREGASVVINGRKADQLAAAEAELSGEGVSVAAVEGSTEDAAVISELLDAAVDHFGRIDLIVNTVGGSPFQGSLEQLTYDGLMGTISLNTWPSVTLIQRALTRGLAEGGGSVVNISSGSPNKTTATMIAYAAAKAALNTLTRTMAADLSRFDVRVNAVSPGLTITSATHAFWEKDGGTAAGGRVPLHRMTHADDIAAACLFLLSDDARQITGQVIDVDGGNHLQGGGWSPFAGGSS
jgi:NAD(P)-dependent dehydrogenase (short-subunit alcohol dehydrogenase family)